MKYKPYEIGAIESSRVKKQERQKLLLNATRSAAKPYDLDKIRSLQVNELIPIEVFYDNISGIWPFILSKVSEGMTLQGIERLIGIKRRTLQSILARIPRLRESINMAKMIQTDDIQLSKMQ